MKLVFNDPTFSFQLLRTIGSSYYGGADIGECLSTAYRIKEGDFESWYSEWFKTAERVRKFGDDSLSSEHSVSARQAYIRASSYYRTAEFFLHENPSDPRIIETWQNSVDCFLKAAEHFSHPFESIEIPYEGTRIPAYFYKSPLPRQNNINNEDKDFSPSSSSSSSPKPTLIVHTGFDGTQEELYSQCVVAALQRGYNCLTFEGPGQGRVIRKQGIPFRYDWERVVSPVIDYVIGRNEIDSNHISLMGISLGGYLAARAAAFEKRIVNCILNDGVFDVYMAFARNFPKPITEIVEQNIISKSEVIDSVIETTMGLLTGARWAYSHGMWVFGVSSPFELLRRTIDYTLKDIINKIECQTLVLEGEKDDSFPGQPKLVYKSLTCPKKYIVFREEEGAEDHCHIGALSLANQRIFDWLDGHINVKR
ncbi:MAG TPA: alpha/beta fold hydrolase [Nitrososphaeraceae archaeon]|nr:alpha/beta fold hydrolase [Nitrososphaeraceae archaeon]